jgi:aryl-alcohol dehydrogenase-like predicted oxidoreductase
MGLGCWAIGGPFWAGNDPLGWGEVDDNESIRAIHRALDLGVTFFDTADVYGAGHSERVLGRALSGQRDRMVIATKFGLTFDETTRQVTGSDASPEYIRRACEASLRRLNTDYIDLYQFHIGIPAAEAGSVLDALDELVTDGLIRAYAWSTDDPECAHVFAERPSCTAVQHELNVLRDAEPILALCEEFDLASVNRSPLAMGLLTGKFQAGSSLPTDDIRGTNPPWMQYFTDGKPNTECLGKLEAVREILTSGGRTLAQGALAWIWARSERTIPIPGFRTVAQVEENVAAMQSGSLTADQMHEIEVLLGR